MVWLPDIEAGPRLLVQTGRGGMTPTSTRVGRQGSLVELINKFENPGRLF